MPRRFSPLVNTEFYHLFNRGVEKRTIFTQKWDYKRFIKSLYYYQFLGPKPSFSNYSKSDSGLFKPLPENKLVEIICYSLMPNHFHILARQLKDNGISLFLGQFLNSYTKYFNIKYSRVGALFQGTFKAVRLETNEQLVHLSRYIHLNPVVSGLVSNLEKWQWSSYSEYMNRPIMCNSAEILNFFPSKEKYKEFLEAQVDLGTTLEILKHAIIEES